MNDPIARRFAAWRVVVIVTLLGDTALAIAPAPAPALRAAGASVASASLLAMWWLLRTTPARAIKLPRGRSEQIIGVATLTLCVIAPRGAEASELRA
jgi:hypothetical protein